MSLVAQGCDGRLPPTEMRSTIIARRFAPDDAPGWDAFVDRSLNGTFMHSRRFLSYHPAEKFRDHSLLFHDPAGNLIAVFPAAEVDLDGKRCLRSHPGASYGGIVFGQGASAVVVRAVVDSLVLHAAEHGFQAIWMRQTERVFHQKHFEEVDAALFQAGFLLNGRELSSAAPTAGCRVDEPPAAFKQKARNAIHKALRSGISARLSDDFAAYWKILESNLRQQHGVKPTHSLEEILRLRELFPGRVELMGGFHQRELVAGTVIFFMNQAAAHTMYMAQNYDFQELRPLNLVIANGLAECARRGIPWLNYGISSIPGSGGHVLNAGLYEFKRSCGGQGVVRDIFQKNLD